VERRRNKFNIRAFVVFVITFCCLGLPITGIANHDYGFSVLTVTRHAWMSAHNILGLLFVVFSIWHIVLNRKALSNYITVFTARASFVSREAVLAGALVMLILTFFVGHAFHL
jgi:hypothetical protein